MDNTIKFETNYCMIYTTSIENNLENEYDYKKRQLLIGEDIINRVILNSFLILQYHWTILNTEQKVVGQKTQ